MLDWQHMLLRVHKRQRSLAIAIAAIAILLVCAACSNDASPPSAARAATAPPIRPTIYATRLVAPPQPPTPTALPTPAPTPTPDVAQLTREARQAAFAGDYRRAIQIGQQVLAIEPDDALRRDLGRWQIEAGDATAAIATLTALGADLGARAPMTDRHVLDAQVLLGRAYALSGDLLGAIAQYSATLAANSVISPWLHVWLGDALLSSNRPGEAIPHFRASIEGAPNVGQEFARREKLALAYQLTGDFAAALEQYDLILGRAQLTAYRARMLWESAQVLLAAGQTSAAYQRMNEIVAQYPRTAQALLAVQALLTAGQPVDELQRGIIGYHNGAHQAAREAFRRAIVLYPERANEVRYWAALNYLKLGSAADALRNLNQTVASNPPAAPATIVALGEIAKLQATRGEVANARAAFQQLIANLPAGETSADVMFNVAQTFARNTDLLSEAIRAYVAAEASHFDPDRGPEALARAAALLYRLGRHAEALATAQAAVDKYAAAPQTALSRLWLGKAQLARGEWMTGTATLQALADGAPDTYEGTRAAELARDPNRAPLSLLPPADMAIGTVSAPPDEQAAAESWLREWLDLDAAFNVRELRDDIRADPRFVRGSALWELGFKLEAREEFEALRVAFARDGLAQYQLALHLRDIGLYRSSIGAADTLMRLSPAKTPSALPTFIAKLLYPTYYADLVLQHAREFDLDPLLIFALIRQESLFEPFAVSSAAANGLMQVIPSTGREIHGDLNWPPNYTTADLQKPYVSIRFGSHYLAKQRRFFGGDLYAALAAYNGGPGNALRWKERSSSDPDLFFLAITFDETQRYIRAIGANYAIYHRLYGR